MVHASTDNDIKHDPTYELGSGQQQAQLNKIVIRTPVIYLSLNSPLEKNDSHAHAWSLGIVVVLTYVC